VPTDIDNPGSAESARPAATLRVFFALWPDAAARDRIVAMARDVARRFGGRAPRPENHHLTLAFVGEVDACRVDALKRIGAASAESADPFTLNLDRVGGFRASGIAWLGTDSPPPELKQLADVLRGELAANGFAVEARPFRAHVTVARHCLAVAAAPVAPVAWPATRLSLVASELRPEGSRYRELEGWPLTRVR
jgi:2'-5' RNA ligase